MSKYKVGNKFIVEIEEIYNGDLVKHEEHMHLHRIKGFNSLVLDEYGLDKLQKYEEEVIATKFYEKGRQEALEDVQNCESYGYEKGLNDALELVKKICGMTRQDLYEIFKIEDAYLADILDDNTYQEAIAKIEAYEESKAIKVGDVVFNAREDVKAVIIDSAIAEGTWQVYTEDCCVELWKECEFKKIGRTVDIEHLLEQIRGNE